MTALTGLLYAAGLALAVVAVLAAVEWHSRRAWKIARQVARLESAVRLGAAIGKLDLAEAELRELRQRAEIAALEARVAELRGELREAEELAREAYESEAEVIAAAQVVRCDGCGEVRAINDLADLADPAVRCQQPKVSMVPSLSSVGGAILTLGCGSCDLCVGEGG